MKTIIVWDQCGDAPIQYAVVDGDYDYLDGVYINGDASEEDEDELNELQSGPDFDLSEEFPYDATNEPFKVIRCGFYP